MSFSIFAMNSFRCYWCMESLIRLKIHKGYIYDEHFDHTDVGAISLFYSDISFPAMVFQDISSPANS